MTSSWLKLNVLVPEPKCRTAGGRVIEWLDTRPQPTIEEINAVTDQQVYANELDKEADNSIESTKFNRFLFNVLYTLNEEIRALKGQGAITKTQFKKALKDIYIAL